MQSPCAILPFVICPTLQYIFTLSYKGHDFFKKKIEYKMFIQIFFKILAETIHIVSRTERDMAKLYMVFHVKCPLFLSYLNET
jgi:hypothetical protein